MSGFLAALSHSYALVSNPVSVKVFSLSIHVIAVIYFWLLVNRIYSRKKGKGCRGNQRCKITHSLLLIKKEAGVFISLLSWLIQIYMDDSPEKVSPTRKSFPTERDIFREWHPSPPGPARLQLTAEKVQWNLNYEPEFPKNNRIHHFLFSFPLVSLPRPWLKITWKSLGRLHYVPACCTVSCQRTGEAP